jgi:hypothetical protein
MKGLGQKIIGPHLMGFDPVLLFPMPSNHQFLTSVVTPIRIYLKSKYEDKILHKILPI